MTAIKTLNAVITALFFLCYAYQFCYILVPLLLGPRPHRAPARLHRFAVLISARNEEAVIGNLIASLRHQSYDASLVDIFVVADNCTDRTAAVAAAVPATVGLPLQPSSLRLKRLPASPARARQPRPSRGPPAPSRGSPVRRPRHPPRAASPNRRPAAMHRAPAAVARPSPRIRQRPRCRSHPVRTADAR